MTFHKLVIIGVPHILPNNVQPSLNKAKSISFKHISSILKNFYELCLQFNNNKPKEEELQKLPKSASASDFSDSNSEEGNSPGSPSKKKSLGVIEEQEIQIKINPKYVKNYNPQKPPEAKASLTNKESEIPDKITEKAAVKESLDDSNSE